MGWIRSGKLSSWFRPSGWSSGRVGVLSRGWGSGSDGDGRDGPRASETMLGPSWGGVASSPASLSVGAGATVIAPGRGVAGVAAVMVRRPPESRLGRYRLIERVGRGRQADVWRALCPEGDVEEVALKVLPASNQGRDPKRRAQLRHEAERGVRFTNPSLLPTYDYGEVDGTAFMAMPLVIGCTLAEVIVQRLDARAGRESTGAHQLATLPEPEYVREVAALMARVARAAHDAHVGRVVHRDIKPGNILVRRDHVTGVYLCDFGLARDLDVATPSQLRDGAGSPLYMAPERLLKRTADEVRCDVFALGVTLCEALTLAPPIHVPGDMPRDLWAAFLTSTPPRRPSALLPTIPPALEDAIVRATDRNPDRRHPTAAALACDLERFLDAQRATWFAAWR